MSFGKILEEMSAEIKIENGEITFSRDLSREVLKQGENFGMDQKACLGNMLLLVMGGLSIMMDGDEIIVRHKDGQLTKLLRPKDGCQKLGKVIPLNAKRI